MRLAQPRHVLLVALAAVVVAAGLVALGRTASGAAQPTAAAAAAAAAAAPAETGATHRPAAARPRTASPAVREMWVAPTVVNVWEHPWSPRPVDRITLTASPAMRTWVHRLTVPLRLGLNGRLMTQAVRGDRVAVLSTRRGWSLVRVESQTGGRYPQGIVGYVPAVQLSRTPRSTSWHAGSRTAATEIAAARSYLGVSYLWGGMSRYRIDCSGLTYAAMRAVGVTVPRDAADQATVGLPVARRHLAAGDLVFFGRGARANIHHVGIYVGHGLVLHAPHTGARVTITPLSAWPDYWGARRILR